MKKIALTICVVAALATVAVADEEIDAMYTRSNLMSMMSEDCPADYPKPILSEFENLDSIDLLIYSQCIAARRIIYRTQAKWEKESSQRMAAQNARIASRKKSMWWTNIIGGIGIGGLCFFIGIPAFIILCACGYSYYNDSLKRSNHRPVRSQKCTTA